MGQHILVVNHISLDISDVIGLDKWGRIMISRQAVFNFPVLLYTRPGLGVCVGWSGPWRRLDGCPGQREHAVADFSLP
jgi:hypothetical protein